MISKRILVAQAEVKVRDLMFNCLKEAGHQVTVLENGQEVMNSVEMQLYDLYLIDIYLPGLDGLEVMLRIREIQPQAVIILTTDYSSIDIAAKALHKGAFHYITKPLEQDELMRAVNSGLTLSEETDEVGSISPASMEISRDMIDLLLLKGFTPEEQREFQDMGTLVKYHPNEKIPLNEQLGSMIWMEKGRVSVQFNGNHVETLRPGDLWGEETFIGANSIFTELIAQAETEVRHFNRRKMLDYFAFHDESLIKRFMINLIQCLYFKWRKCITKTGQQPAYSAYIPNSDVS